MMNTRALLLLTAILTIGVFLAGPSPASAQPMIRPCRDLSLPGSPFAVTPTRDGKYVFASLSGATNGIAIIRQDHASARLVRVLPTGGGAWGLTVTRDGKYLLDTVQPANGATAPEGVQIIDIHRALTGRSDAILGTVPTGVGSGPIEVALSNDNRFVFATNEDNATVSVIDFRKALASRVSASSLIGNIPVEQLPVGLAFSPDGRYLYISNEAADPTIRATTRTRARHPPGSAPAPRPAPKAP